MTPTPDKLEHNNHSDVNNSINDNGNSKIDSKGTETREMRRRKSPANIFNIFKEHGPDDYKNVHDRLKQIFPNETADGIEAIASTILLKTINEYKSTEHTKYDVGRLFKDQNFRNKVFENIEKYKDRYEQLLSNGATLPGVEVGAGIGEQVVAKGAVSILTSTRDLLEVVNLDDVQDLTTNFSNSYENAFSEEDVIILSEASGEAKEKVKICFIKHKNYTEKLGRGEELTEKEEIEYQALILLLGTDGRGGYVGKLRELKRLKDLKVEDESKDPFSSINTSKEYATGNIKDIKPAAIVENNEKINNYVYKNKDENLPDLDHIQLSRDDKERLFKKLRELKEKEGDRDFKDSIEYINKDLTINYKRMKQDHINELSVKTNLEKIIKMVNDLAKQEKIEEFNKEKIKNVNTRKCAMVCCFRAISKFFDTPNNNGENFASEFEISDVNEDINFDEGTGVISMEGTIGANKNHIKLYYDTNKGTLEFDNFLAFNNNDKYYKIGKGNGEREKIKIELPTMDEMENAAKSINFRIINNLSGGNMDVYNRMISFSMRESIRLKCFRGILGGNINTNKSFIKRFNEKNILKQDIIKNIYKMFYSEKDINTLLDSKTEFLSISKAREPEQFKLIKLISDSIDHYDDAGQLLRFRNYVNQFDKILTTEPRLIKNDVFMKQLFANNLDDNQDMTDISKNTVSEESKGNMSVVDNGNMPTYHSAQKYKHNGDKQLSYYKFLSLLSELKDGGKTIINLGEFKNTLQVIIAKKNVLSNEKSLFFRNYESKKEALGLPDFEIDKNGNIVEKEKELAKIEKEMDKAYDNPNEIYND